LRASVTSTAVLDQHDPVPCGKSDTTALNRRHLWERSQSSARAATKSHDFEPRPIRVKQLRMGLGILKDHLEFVFGAVNLTTALGDLHGVDCFDAFRSV
jgi:hypothetical protein